MRLAGVLLALIAWPAASAETVTLAVASNFRVTAELLAGEFAANKAHELRISSGSTGKLHAQILHGAPFDLFLAANEESPQLLEASGHGIRDTRFTYAIGTLVLWSGDANAADCQQELKRLGKAKLAIANPETAPYGLAAKEFLVNAGLWDRVAGQLVFGENIAQALHFAVTGNAHYALVANAQVIDPALPVASCSWPVPTELYTPIEQQVVLLQHARQNVGAREFLEYLQSDAARRIISESGYGVP